MGEWDLKRILTVVVCVCERAREQSPSSSDVAILLGGCSQKDLLKVGEGLLPYLEDARESWIGLGRVCVCVAIKVVSDR